MYIYREKIENTLLICMLRKIWPMTTDIQDICIVDEIEEGANALLV